MQVKYVIRYTIGPYEINNTGYVEIGLIKPINKSSKLSVILLLCICYFFINPKKYNAYNIS